MRRPFRDSLLVAVAPLLLLLAGCDLADFERLKDRHDRDGEPKSLSARLSGENEVPPADSNGRGKVELSLDLKEETLCFDISVESLEPVTAAHLHEGAAGVNGPIVIDLNATTPTPKWCTKPPPVSVLQPSSSAAGDGFGRALAFDGDTAIIGADGVAYVFVRKSGAWAEQQKLVAPDNDFGVSVALSFDTAAVSAENVVYVYVRSHDSWIEQQTLTSPHQVDEDFGAAVALSKDTLLVGAPGFESRPGSSDVGAAYVFVRSGKSWSEQARLRSGLGFTLSTCFACAVAVSGEFALAGGLTVRSVGSVLLFERTGSTWSTVELDATSSLGGRLGDAVAISGTTAIVGAPGHLVFQEEVLERPIVASGAAQVFELSEQGWVKQQMAPVPGQPERLPVGLLTPRDLVGGAGVGTSVAVSGNLAVVGAPGSTAAGRPPPPEAAYVFERSGELWSEREKLEPPPDREVVDYGAALAMSADTVLVGAPGDESTPGAVFVHALAAASSCELSLQKLDGCVEVDRKLLDAIRSEPEKYYLNVHTAEFPDGAVRGQLEDDGYRHQSR